MGGPVFIFDASDFHNYDPKTGHFEIDMSAVTTLSGMPLPTEGGPPIPGNALTTIVKAVRYKNQFRCTVKEVHKIGDHCTVHSSILGTDFGFEKNVMGMEWHIVKRDYGWERISY